MLRERPAKASARRSLVGIAGSAVQNAERLRRALSCAFALPCGASLTDRIRAAAPAFASEFGRTVSDRHLRSLITRAIQRDGGRRNFDDLRLYLSGRPAKHAVKAGPIAAAFPELDRAFAEIVSDRARVTIGEIANCWREILSLFNDRIAAGVSEGKLKRQLRSYIVSASPFLGATPAAVKRNLNRKLREMIDGGGIDQVADGRLNPMKRGRKAPSDFSENIKLLVRHAAFFCSGRISQAYRQLHQGTAHNSDRFSDDFRALYPFDVRTAKSEVPALIRRSAAPAVAALRPHVLGPRAARLSLPSIHRDWSGVGAGDSYTSDDVTLNHYVVDFCDGGEYEAPDGRRFNVVRPQFLPVVDERTSNPLGFSLIPLRSYSSFHIRTLMTRICMSRAIGLPFEQFLFESGIWKARNVQALVSWSDIDEGFARHGIHLRLRHATTPKAKIIEQVIGALQNRDDFAPGYVGRDEQGVKFERVHQFLLRLKRIGQPRKIAIDPSEMLMTLAQCDEMLAATMRRFADEPQNGERLQGLSPAEGWTQLAANRPHTVLPESLRYLLAASESIQTVKSEGIVLRVGRLKHYYAGSDRLGALIGEKVRVRYNPELPEHIVVAHIASDPRGLNPFSVPLFDRVPAHGAAAEQFAAAREHQNRFASFGRALYRELAPKANTTICHSEIGSLDLRAAGEAHNQLEREHVDLTATRDRERTSIGRLAAAHGRAIDPGKVRNPERVKKHLESAATARQRILELEKESVAIPKEGNRHGE
jgi:hypothetical protein